MLVKEKNEPKPESPTLSPESESALADYRRWKLRGYLEVEEGVTGISDRNDIRIRNTEATIRASQLCFLLKVAAIDHAKFNDY